MKSLNTPALVLGLCLLGLPLQAATLNADLEPDPQGAYSYDPPGEKENGHYLIEIRDENGALYARLGNSTPDLATGRLTGPWELYYPSGQLSERRPVSDSGQFEGEAKRWREDGTLLATVPYVNGRKDGVETTLYRNGEVAMKTTWQAGQATGPLREFYSNGQLRAETMRKDGQRDGVQKLFYENGQLQAEIQWKNGQRDGPYRGYDEAGNLTEEGNYGGGEREMREVTYWPGGQKKSETHHDPQGNPIGTQKDWNSAGDLRQQTDYSEDGTFLRERYFADGKVTHLREPTTVEGHGPGEREVTYKGNRVETAVRAGDYRLITTKRNGKLIDRFEQVGDKMIGLSMSTSELEPVTTTAHYVDGRLDGMWTKIWRGRVLDKGMYRNDKRVGKWQRVEQAGQFIHETYDDQGRLNGPARTLNEQGELIQLATYDHGTLDGPWRKMRRGRLVTGGTYSDGVKTGDWREQDTYRTTARTGHYTDGQKDGTWKLLDRQGYVLEQAEFSGDQRDGPRYIFRDDGSLKEMQSWDHDRRDGYTTYFDQGRPAARDLWRDNHLLKTGLPPAEARAKAPDASP